jgi:hypothetical protein
MYEPDPTDILNPTTGEVVKQCHGPALDGGCPGANPDGTVLCEGCLVESPNAGPEYWNILVPPQSRHCPRAWNLGSCG